MPRANRTCPAGMFFHCLNRAVARLQLFEKETDYISFERVLLEAHERTSLPILDYTIMPNHWHFVVCPETDTEVSEFFGWLTLTHTMRWHAHYETGGTGHLYQGRFKSFPIQDDDHLINVLRYVERNPVHAGLTQRVQDWPWGSAWHRSRRTRTGRRLLSNWPLENTGEWLDYANTPHSQTELVALRNSVQRGTPFGDQMWTRRSAARLGLNSTLRRRGRPRKKGSRTLFRGLRRAES